MCIFILSDMKENWKKRYVITIHLAVEEEGLQLKIPMAMLSVSRYLIYCKVNG